MILGWRGIRPALTCFMIFIRLPISILIFQKKPAVFPDREFFLKTQPFLKDPSARFATVLRQLKNAST